MNPRLVALGDSVALGREDPAPDGSGGWHGWVPRLAARLGIPPAAVANTAAEGAQLADVVAHQMPLVTDARPEIVAFICGTNDVIGGADPGEVTRALDTLLAWAGGTGALVLTAGVLPCWEKLPLSRVRRARLEGVVARFNADLAALAAGHGASCLDPAALPGVAGEAGGGPDPALWAGDGIHLSSAGHEVLARGFARLARARQGAGDGVPRTATSASGRNAAATSA